MTAPPITHNDLMHATSHAMPFSGRGWLFELKYDGFRALLIKRKRDFAILSRTGRNMARSYPELVDALEDFPDAVIDAELVVLDSTGRPLFDQVRRRSLTTVRQSVSRAAASQPAALFAFDLLYLEGRDLRQDPLTERKERLFRLIPPDRRIRYLSHIDENGLEFYRQVCDLRLEGMVAKQADSAYIAGRRREWLKIKTPAWQEVSQQRFKYLRS